MLDSDQSKRWLLKCYSFIVSTFKGFLLCFFVQFLNYFKGDNFSRLALSQLTTVLIMALVFIHVAMCGGHPV